MNVKTSVEVVGVKDTLKQLRELDPELRKQFAKDVRQIARPLTDDAKNLYMRTLPSGFGRSWGQGQGDRRREFFPWSVGNAKKGISVRITTSKRSRSVISVRQNNPAAAIIEFAGTKNYNSFAAQTSLIFGRTRGKVMWQAADNNLDKITKEIELSVQAGSKVVQRRLSDIKNWRT